MARTRPGPWGGQLVPPPPMPKSIVGIAARHVCRPVAAAMSGGASPPPWPFGSAIAQRDGEAAAAAGAAGKLDDAAAPVSVMRTARRCAGRVLGFLIAAPQKDYMSGLRGGSYRTDGRARVR